MSELIYTSDDLLEIGADLQAAIDKPATGADWPILGVGRLAEVVGLDEACDWFEERDKRQQFLYHRALKRWGLNRMA